MCVCACKKEVLSVAASHEISTPAIVRIKGTWVHSRVCGDTLHSSVQMSNRIPSLVLCMSDLTTVDAPTKRKFAQSHSAHMGLRYDSARDSVKLIMLSRFLKEKDEGILESASVSKDGIELVHHLQLIMLKLCQEGGSRLLTDVDMKTLFRQVGSNLNRESLWEAQLSLPKRLSIDEAQRTYHIMLEALGSAQETPAGVRLRQLLVPGGMYTLPDSEESNAVLEVVNELQAVVDLVSSGTVDAISGDGVDDGDESQSAQSSSTRETRSTSTAPPDSPSPPPLAPVVRDHENQRPVYVDLRSEGDSDALRAVLRESAPAAADLDGLKAINKGRILFDIRSSVVADTFAAFLRQAVSVSSVLREMLIGIMEDGAVLMLGMQYIVPKVTGTAYDACSIQQQEYHPDVPDRGEMYSIAVNAFDENMNTRIDERGTKNVRSSSLGVAATSIFCFDGGVMHAGPGRKEVAGPFPFYDTKRAFFLLASPSLGTELIINHRSYNGLERLPALIQLEPPNQRASAIDTTLSLAKECLRIIEERFRRQATALEEKTLLRSLLEALTPLPSANEKHRLWILLSPVLEGLSDPAGAQLFASLKEVLRISEGQSTPSMAKVCEQIIAKTGNVAGNSLDCMQYLIDPP